MRKASGERRQRVSSSLNAPLWEGSTDRERQEMRKEEAIRESHREARQMARAKRWRRIRCLTLSQVTYIGVGLIFAILFALVAID